ncbi:hypothetical protein MY11210_005248 [Beauveria gryllotalpidicola]
MYHSNGGGTAGADKTVSETPKTTQLYLGASDSHQSTIYGGSPSMGADFSAPAAGLLGPAFAAPTCLAAEPSIRAAAANVTALLDELFRTGHVAVGQPARQRHGACLCRCCASTARGSPP